MTKLKYKEIAEYREAQLSRQLGACALCSEPIQDDAVLDHDHKTGMIRSVLHRGCNALLGKIENNMARNRITVERLQNLSNNLVRYINSTHTDLTHPTYKEKTMPGRGRGRKPPKR